MHSMQKIVSLLSRAHGTAIGHRLALALQLGRFEEIPSLISQVMPDSPFSDKQVAALVSKTEGLDVGIDTKKAAEQAFEECESACRETNIRLTRYVNWFENGFYGSEPDLKLYDYIARVRKRIADVLGPVPDLTPRFSNGSTFHDRGDCITLPHKMSGQICITSPFEEFGLLQVLRQTLWWPSADGVVYEQGNRFTTVTKNYKTDRGICVEPSGNLALQLAAGGHIRRRLYTVGIEIDGVGNRNALTADAAIARSGCRVHQSLYPPYINTSE